MLFAGREVRIEIRIKENCSRCLAYSPESRPVSVFERLNVSGWFQKTDVQVSRISKRDEDLKGFCIFTRKVPKEII